MIRTTLGHYRIHALLGRGGMGEVYRATDGPRRSLPTPSVGSVAREELAKWYLDPRLLEEMLDGLRRAGLEVS